MLTILTIDDDSTILSVVESYLEEAGYQTLSALSGEMGLEMAHKYLPDAVILDRQMPDMDGEKVLELLKGSAVTKDIPVVMLTGDNKMIGVAACLKMGAADYVVKPFDSDNFLYRLNKVLNK